MYQVLYQVVSLRPWPESRIQTPDDSRLQTCARWTVHIKNQESRHTKLPDQGWCPTYARPGMLSHSGGTNPLRRQCFLIFSFCYWWNEISNSEIERWRLLARQIVKCTQNWSNPNQLQDMSITNFEGSSTHSFVGWKNVLLKKVPSRHHKR